MLANIRVAWMLAQRQIQNTSHWTTALVIFIMMLTFLNLVVVSGILVGIVEGAVQANREQSTGDIFITTPAGKSDLAFTHNIVTVLDTLPEVDHYSIRYLSGATLEAGYRKERPIGELSDTVGTTITGINPTQEDKAIGLSGYLVEGTYLNKQETGYILLGVNLLESYLENFGNTDIQGLADVEIGEKVLVTVNGKTREFTIKGLLDTKAGDVSLRAFVTRRDFIELTGRTTQNANEISVFLEPGTSADLEKERLLASGISTEYAVIETWEEAQGQFLEDIKGTFSLLGAIIGGIALVVASITIFIIIFVNAISRRKFIGILKGIGIQGRAITLAYIIQSLFYAVSGSLIGVLLTYGILIPYFEMNPIDFPFSDGILVAPIDQTSIRLAVLLLCTIVAGLVPAQIIIRKNTLDSILGR